MLDNTNQKYLYVFEFIIVDLYLKLNSKMSGLLSIKSNKMLLWLYLLGLRIINKTTTTCIVLFYVLM
jgi:hypothetical protein